MQTVLLAIFFADESGLHSFTIPLTQCHSSYVVHLYC